MKGHVNMRPIGEAGYVLTLREFMFLAALCGIKKLHGIEFNGNSYGEKQLKEQWKEVSSQLVYKKYIDVELDGEITLDKELHAIIMACGNPEAIVKVEGRCHNNISRLFYIAEKFSVQLDIDKMVKDKIILTPITSLDKLAMNYSECFVFEDTYNTENNFVEVHCDADKLSQCTDIVDDKHAVESLISIGFSELTAHKFYSALKEKLIVSSVSWFLADGQTGIYTIVVGEDTLWSLKTDNMKSSMVLITACSTQNAEKGAYDMIVSMKNRFENMKGGTI